MKRSVLLVLAVAASVPSAASAEPARYGGICKALTQYSEDRPGETTGFVHGGPFAVTEDGLPATARMVCSIQEGSRVHSAPDLVTAPGPVSTGVVFVPPTTFEAPGDFAVDRILCTRVEVVDGPTYYYDGAAEAWTTDPDAPCEATFGGSGLVLPYAASVYCPVLATVPLDAGALVIEPGGDVVVAGSQLLNCPSYED